MRLGSICTGSGMFDRALCEIFGAVPVWGCDNDPVAARLASHRLCVPVYPDVAQTNWENVSEVDVLAAGWPCQPFSVAGRKQGRDDDRAIWPEIGRAIRLLRPRYVVLENVPGVLGAGSGEFTRVGNDLAAFGYEFRWQTLRASEAGAPHRRDRVFVLGRHEGFPEQPDITAPLIPPVKPINALLPTPCATDGERTGSRPQDIDGERNVRLADFVLDDEAMLKVRPALRRWTNISRRKPPPMFQSTSSGRIRLAPAYVEWMMGWPAGWVTEIDQEMPGGWVPGKPNLPLPTEAAFRLIGNGVVPQQVKMAMGRLFNYREEARIYGIE